MARESVYSRVVSWQRFGLAACILACSLIIELDCSYYQVSTDTYCPEDSRTKGYPPTH